jgi:hypothetical protein
MKKKIEGALGVGARSAPFLVVTGVRSAWARTRGQNPLVYHVFV